MSTDLSTTVGPHVVALSLADEELLTLDALADAISRVDPKLVQHHRGDLPVVLLVVGVRPSIPGEE